MDDDADCTNCGDPYQLDGREPAAHGMCYQCASDHIPVLNAKVSALELQVEEYRKALEFCTGFKGSCPEGSRVAREVLERFTEKPEKEIEKPNYCPKCGLIGCMDSHDPRFEGGSELRVL